MNPIGASGSLAGCFQGNTIHWHPICFLPQELQALCVCSSSITAGNKQKHLFPLDLVRSCHVLWWEGDRAWKRAACALLWGTSICFTFPALLMTQPRLWQCTIYYGHCHLPPRKLIPICQCDRRSKGCMTTCMKQQSAETKGLTTLRKKRYIICKRSPKRGLRESSQTCVSQQPPPELVVWFFWN